MAPKRTNAEASMAPGGSVHIIIYLSREDLNIVRRTIVPTESAVARLYDAVRAADPHHAVLTFNDYVKSLRQAPASNAIEGIAVDIDLEDLGTLTSTCDIATHFPQVSLYEALMKGQIAEEHDEDQDRAQTLSKRVKQGKRARADSAIATPRFNEKEQSKITPPTVGKCNDQGADKTFTVKVEYYWFTNKQPDVIGKSETFRVSPDHNISDLFTQVSAMVPFQRKGKVSCFYNKAQKIVWRPDTINLDEPDVEDTFRELGIDHDTTLEFGPVDQVEFKAKEHKDLVQAFSSSANRAPNQPLAQTHVSTQSKVMDSDSTTAMVQETYETTEPHQEAQQPTYGGHDLPAPAHLDFGQPGELPQAHTAAADPDMDPYLRDQWNGLELHGDGIQAGGGADIYDGAGSNDLAYMGRNETIIGDGGDGFAGMGGSEQAATGGEEVLDWDEGAYGGDGFAGDGSAGGASPFDIQNGLLLDPAALYADYNEG